MRITMFDLNGVWEMQKDGEESWYPASVPGTMYKDLLGNGRIEDPFYGENEFAARELSADNYRYRRSFTVSGELLKNEKNVLVCKGIDTLADITLNGQPIGHCENMHREYRFDITSVLREGENEIEVFFYAPLAFVRQQNERKPIWGVDTTVPGYQYIRKAHCMFGWDWGPQLPDLGIWRDIYIEEINDARIDAVYVRQKGHDKTCRLTVEVKNECTGAQTQAELVCEIYAPDGSRLSEQRQGCGEENTFSYTVEAPELWWPNGYGEQPLYLVKLHLEKDGRALDEKKVQVGIRDFTVVRRKDIYGESFSYCINGREIFARGANYIPEDSIFGRRSEERTRRLLEDCAKSGYNCIRVWGGGNYPDDWFFDACDRLGLLVWEDFMFACAVYDLTDAFEANLRAEFIDNIRRLRNHPSLGLWCGNNEMESAWDGWGLPKNEKLRQDYLYLYERMIPDILAKEDPDRFYWPSSPSSGGGFEEPSSEDRGDAHYWDVWHGRKPFEDVEKKYFRFFSEYGFVSLPAKSTLRKVIDEDQFNIVSPQMETHQKCAEGNLTLMHYLLRYYQNPSDFDTLIYTTQSLQGDYLEMAIRHLRSHRERCSGSTYWQVNDTCPTMSWATIDYYGRWKGSHYIVKRSYQPCIAYAEPDASGTVMSVYASGELLEAKEVTVFAELIDQKEGVLLKQTKECVLPALSSVEAIRLVLPAGDLFADRERYIHYGILVDGVVADEGNRLLTAPKHFAFRDPALTACLRENDGKVEIAVSAAAFARRVALEFGELDVLLSDNYFDLQPGETKTVQIVEVREGAGASAESLREQLRVYSNYSVAK